MLNIQSTNQTILNVSIGKQLLEEHQVFSGVPQGTILGPDFICMAHSALNKTDFNNINRAIGFKYWNVCIRVKNPNKGFELVAQNYNNNIPFVTYLDLDKAFDKMNVKYSIYKLNDFEWEHRQRIIRGAPSI